jgi:hypothetical protein
MKKLLIIIKKQLSIITQAIMKKQLIMLTLLMHIITMLSNTLSMLLVYMQITTAIIDKKYIS